MFEEPLLGRPYRGLGPGVVLSQFAAVEAEAERRREGPEAQCLRCECCCQASDHRELSVPSVPSTPCTHRR